MNMPMPNFYPKLDENAIKQARKLVASVPGYLDDKECPYSAELKALFVPPVTTVLPLNSNIEIEDIDFREMDSDMLIEEINELYSKLKASGTNIGNADDKSEGSERNVYFRLMTSLLKDVVEMKTKLTDAAHIAEFKQIVLDAMEDILDPDQRNLFMQRIKQLEE